MSGIPPLLADALSFRPQSLAEANCRSLASIVAALINENEPLLSASSEGDVVTVHQRGGGTAMQIAVRAVEKRQERAI